MIIQFTGSIVVLIVFALNQFHMLTSTSKIYLLGNVIGSSFLGYDAFRHEQWGFLLLEFIWTLVSLISLIRECVNVQKAKKN